jgi:membrane protein DedA with SNARE-associated domain
VASLAASLWFGVRAYRSFLLLQSAYGLGMPQAGNIRAWMTLRYVAATYRVPESLLIGRLALPPETPPDTTLKSLAEREGLSRFSYVQRVQQAIAQVAPSEPSGNVQTSESWLQRVEERFLSALLIYGYPILALMLLLGAIGFPLPTGLSVAIAGSLSALVRMDWLAAGTIATLASILGDLAAYGIGRATSDRVPRRWGRWLGYMSTRQGRAEVLFEHWAGLTIVLSRTLISHLSSAVSLLAGLQGYRMHAFLAFTALGRLIWTAAYMALGYTLAGNLDAATGLLANVAGLLLSLAVLAASALLAR